MSQHPPTIPPISTYLLDLSSQRQIAMALKAHRVLAIKVYEADGRESKLGRNETIFGMQEWGEMEKGYPSAMRTSEKEHLNYRDDGVTYKTRLFKIETNQYGNVTENVSILDIEYTCDGSTMRVPGAAADESHRLRFLVPQKYAHVLNYYNFDAAPLAFDVVCPRFNKDQYGNTSVDSDTLLHMKIAPYPHSRAVAHIARAQTALHESAAEALSVHDPLWLNRFEFAATHKALQQVMKL